MSGLPERLRYIRTKFKLSQKEMAKKFGLGANTWQRYELGLSVPGFEVLEQIIFRLGVSGTWLLSGNGDVSHHYPQTGKMEISDGDIVEPANVPEFVYRRIDIIDAVCREELPPASLDHLPTENLPVAENVPLNDKETGIGRSAKDIDRPAAKSAGIDPTLVGRVLEAISTVYLENGYTLTLGQLGAKATEIAADLSADLAIDAPNEEKIGAVKAAAAMLRRQLREASANPAGEISRKHPA